MDDRDGERERDSGNSVLSVHLDDDDDDDDDDWIQFKHQVKTAVVDSLIKSVKVLSIKKILIISY